MAASVDCDECGSGIGLEELIHTLLGIDEKVMFPSLSAKLTGKIIRERIIKSKLKPKKKRN